MSKGYASRTVESATRLTNSVNGNPRYRIAFTDGSSALTQTDAGFVYAVGNPDMRGDVEVKFTRAGRIEGHEAGPQVTCGIALP